MAKMLPVALYGLKVPAGNVVIPAAQEFPATFRITMAAIDPTAASDHAHPRATLKMFYDPSGPGDQESEGSQDEDDYLQALQEGLESDGLSDEEEDDESSDEDEMNGGPSDPSKSTKARKEAAAKKLIKALVEQDSGNDSDEEMEDSPPKLNGIAKASKADKGKGKATAVDLDDVDEEGDAAIDGLEEVVLCTLDPEKKKTCQQPLDITVPEDQPTFFRVTGSHTVYLTGNYVIPSEDGPGDGALDQDEYDFSPDEDELGLDEDDSDELDDIADPRVTEIDTDDDEQVPQLTEDKLPKLDAQKKGKNKRPANDLEEESREGATLDEIISKSLKPEDAATSTEPKLSKKQKKKLKNNAGLAVEATGKDKQETPEKQRDQTAKPDKKVSFAKNLEQGPTSSQSTVKPDVNGVSKNQAKKQEQGSKGSLGVKVIQGVKIDDRKLGTGPAAKKGDKLGMRYIGKLNDGRVFDANKKGPPFRFRLGAGDVIQGWDIGLNGMSVNGERRITVPAHLGYGSKKQGSIPPNSELTFDLKLLEIN